MKEYHFQLTLSHKPNKQSALRSRSSLLLSVSPFDSLSAKLHFGLSAQLRTAKPLRRNSFCFSFRPICRWTRPVVYVIMSKTIFKTIHLEKHKATDIKQIKCAKEHHTSIDCPIRPAERWNLAAVVTALDESPLIDSTRDCSAPLPRDKRTFLTSPLFKKWRLRPLVWVSVNRQPFFQRSFHECCE